MSNENQNGKKGGPLGNFKVKIQSSGTSYWLIVPTTAGTKCTWTTDKTLATTGGTTTIADEVNVKNWKFGNNFITKDGSSDNVITSTTSDTNWNPHPTSGQDPVYNVISTTKLTRYLDRRGGNGSDMNDAVLTTVPIITRDP